MTPFVYLAALLLGCLLGFITTAEAHTDAIVRCYNFAQDQIKKVAPDGMNEGGYVTEYYSTTGRTRVDLKILSHPDAGSGHKANPAHWFVDLDNNNSFDIVFTDQEGLGQCKDMIVAYSLTPRGESFILDRKNPALAAQRDLALDEGRRYKTQALDAEERLQELQRKNDMQQALNRAEQENRLNERLAEEQRLEQRRDSGSTMYHTVPGSNGSYYLYGSDGSRRVCYPGYQNASVTCQ